MKVILEFNLPEDIDDWNIQKNAVKYYMALEDVRLEVRRMLKYDDTLSEDMDFKLRRVMNLLPNEDEL